MSTTEIRPATAADFDVWLPLWKGYQDFYRVDIADAVTRNTWDRLLDPAEPMHVALAYDGGKAIGMVHWIFHRSTWTAGDYCYLQDLYVTPEARGTGAGRKLIEHVYAQAAANNAARVYWLTHETNATAMQLYDRIADRSGFIQYRRCCRDPHSRPTHPSHDPEENPVSARDPDCPLCQEDGGALLWRGPHLRVIEVNDPDYPGFTRVIWNGHLAEMTSLSAHGRELLMKAVYVVEETQQAILSPDKINLASLGNMVPHLHWHVIPRWRGDRHFPDPIWAPARIAKGAEPAELKARLARTQAQLPRYRDRLVEAMNALLWH